MEGTIAVTGAAGHLGSHICAMLVKLPNIKVKALCYDATAGIEGLDIEIHKGDVRDYSVVSDLVKDADYVIHCAAVISINGDPEGRVFTTNTQGPANMVKACLEHGVKRLVHISSTHAVHEWPHDTDYDETRPYKTKSDFVYDYSKATGEQTVLNAIKNDGLNAVICRPSSMVGAPDPKNSLIGLALLDLWREKIPALPEGGYNFVDVVDVAEAVINAIDRGRTGEIYLLSGTFYTMTELAQLIHKVTGKRTPKREIPLWVMRLGLPFVQLGSKITGGEPVYTKESIVALKHGHPRMINDKAKKELGLKVRPFEETLEQYYTWGKETGKIE